MLHSTFLKDEVVEQFDGFFSCSRSTSRPTCEPAFHSTSRSAMTRSSTCGRSSRPTFSWRFASSPNGGRRLGAEERRLLRADYGPYQFAQPADSRARRRLAARRRALPQIPRSIDVIDLEPPFRGAAGGVRLASLGALRQAIAFGLAGFKFSKEASASTPSFPARLTASNSLSSGRSVGSTSASAATTTCWKSRSTALPALFA